MDDDILIERVLLGLGSEKSGRLNVQKVLDSEFNIHEDSISYRIAELMEDKGYARRISGGTTLHLLPMGLEVLKSGGHLKYIKQISRNESRDAERMENEANNIKYNLKLNHFYWRWRWLPFVLSIFAILISLYALFAD